MNISIDSLRNTVNFELIASKVYGEGADSQGVSATRKINEEVLIKAESISKEFKDSYISVEHVMLCMMETESKSGCW